MLKLDYKRNPYRLYRTKTDHKKGKGKFNEKSEIVCYWNFCRDIRRWDFFDWMWRFCDRKWKNKN